MEHEKSTEQDDIRQPWKTFFKTQLNLLNADVSFCRKVIWQREDDYLQTEQKPSCSPAGNLKTLTSGEHRACTFNQIEVGLEANCNLISLHMYE